MAGDVSFVRILTVVDACPLGVFTGVDIALSGVLRDVCLAGLLTTYVSLVWVLNVSLVGVLK